MSGIEPYRRLRWQSVSEVVAVFTGAGSSGRLADAAATTASVLGATLTGLYVRDIALQDLANLPFAATLGATGARMEQLTPEAIERTWAREEARCRAALAVAVKGAMHGWSFEAAVGRLEAVLAPRLARATLVAMSAEDRTADARLWGLACTMSGAAGAVLVVPSAAVERGRGPVLAIDDGDRAGAETIALADRIAQATGRPLAVLAFGTPMAIQALARRVRSLAPSPAVAVHTWPDWRADEIADPIARIAPSMIVGDFAGLPFADPTAATRIFRRLTAPLLLISSDAGKS